MSGLTALANDVAINAAPPPLFKFRTIKQREMDIIRRSVCASASDEERWRGVYTPCEPVARARDEITALQREPDN